ncbi:MAG: transcriptional repressor [Candidatus Marinimicrobia bacterium]|nr:transcriptional repressor [Candidatus Neomarinimicrobiota bacterium]
MKCTPARLSIFKEVYSSSEHFDADEIYFRLRSEKKRVSRATVYRTLDLLVENGFVSKVNVGQSQVHFENTLAQKHHEHLVCTQCGKIIEFNNKLLEEEQNRICKEYGFLPTKHNLIVFGLCDKCQRRSD